MVSSLIRTATFFMTAIASSNAAFVSQNAGSSTTFLRTSTVPRVSNLEPLHLFDTNVASDVVTTAANNMWLATIDSDIASIDDNQFGLVFAGGIAVMVGGVVSALIVGAILDKGDLYANVAAESYLQSEDDEEFWKALSEEEKKKAKDIMEKIKQSKSDGPLSSPVQASVEEVATPETETKKDAPKAPDAAATASKPTDMFSDYSD